MSEPASVARPRCADCCAPVPVEILQQRADRARASGEEATPHYFGTPVPDDLVQRALWTLRPAKGPQHPYVSLRSMPGARPIPIVAEDIWTCPACKDKWGFSPRERQLSLAADLENMRRRLTECGYVVLPPSACKAHTPAFDLEAAKLTSSDVIRMRWPRFDGTCSVCGYSGIAYASYEHYVYGDW